MASWMADRETLGKSGFAIEVVRERDTFVEALVSKGPDNIVLQWALGLKSATGWTRFNVITRCSAWDTWHGPPVAKTPVLAPRQSWNKQDERRAIRPRRLPRFRFRVRHPMSGSCREVGMRCWKRAVKSSLRCLPSMRANVYSTPRASFLRAGGGNYWRHETRLRFAFIRVHCAERGPRCARLLPQGLAAGAGQIHSPCRPQRAFRNGPRVPEVEGMSYCRCFLSLDRPCIRGRRENSTV